MGDDDMLGGGQNFRKQRPGQPIQARVINRPKEAVERLSRRALAPGLAGGTVAGVPVERVVRETGFLAKLTGGGPNGKYAWRGVYWDKEAGDYLDLPDWISGTVEPEDDPAYEYNANEDLETDGSVVVWLEREFYSGLIIFQTDNCG